MFFRLLAVNWELEYRKIRNFISVSKVEVNTFGEGAVECKR
jgi:hypothetical protein